VNVFPLFAIGLISTVTGQDPVAVPQFEVATVKPIDPDPNLRRSPGVRIYPGARVVISATSLKGLVAIAFHLSYWEISGGDPWIEKDEYDIEAKPSDSPQSGIKTLRYSWYGIEDEQLRAMLQTLLIDRFQLKFHREAKTGNVYMLERTGKPFRMRPTVIPDAGPNHSGDVGFAGGRWVLSNTSMPQLAAYAAANILHAPVSDRTELSGWFDYRQPAALTESEANYKDPSDSFLRLIPELGLKLYSTKGPVETFVIDQAKKPSPN
jgi:uncharacterized protein (TIGR03435 family)